MPQPPTSESIYNHFVSLGLSQSDVSLEDFTRLYSNHGPLSDALLFLSQHLVGRDRTKEIRYAIASHPAQNPFLKSAQSRFASAQKSVEVYRRELDDKSVDLAKLENEHKLLREELEHKNRVALLLKILEEKERLRLKRFEEMRVLVGKLRKDTVAWASQTQTQTTHVPTLPADTVQDIKLPRISHTKDALSVLHAHHARGHALPLTPRSPHITRIDLDRKLTEIEEKERALQLVSNRTAAILWTCGKLVEFIGRFQKFTLGVLRVSLEESKETRGYVEIFRHFVMENQNRRRRENVCHDPEEDQMKEVLSIRGNIVSTVQMLVEDVEKLIMKAHSKRVQLENLQLTDTGPPPPHICAEYEAQARVEESAARKLLTRKVAKAEVMGDSLKKDLETLIQEVEFIVRQHRKEHHQGSSRKKR